MREEKTGTLRWAIYLLAALALGPLAGALIAALRAPDGGADATPLVSTAPVLGAVLALAAAAIALLPGLASAYLVDPKAGMIAAGLVLAWPAYRSGTVPGLLSGGADGVLPRLAAEGLLVGALAVGIAAAIERAGRRLGPPPAVKGPPIGSLLPALAAAVIAGSAAAWAIAQTPMTGQAFAAAVLGGVAAGAAAHLVDPRVPLSVVAGAVAALAVLGPLSGLLSGDAVMAARMGSLFPLAHVTPLHWAAGGLIGVPMGVAWAASMMEKKAEGKAGPVS